MSSVARGGAARLPIARVEVHGVAMPLVGPGFRNAYSTRMAQRSAVVCVHTHDGRVGLGNIDPSPGYSAQTIEQLLVALRERLGPAAIGQDAANPHRVLERLDAVLAGYIDAKAAIEMACVDLTARHLDVAVHEWLGGAVVERLSFNAWIGIDPPEDAATEARRWFDQGFRSCKVKVGGGVDNDVARVRAVREAVGPGMRLRVDANAGYTVDQAIALGRALEPLDVQWVEQPVDARDLAGMATVRRRIGIAVMADESITDHASLVATIRADCADYVKLKVMKQGGFLRCRRMVETAAAAGLGVIIGHGFGLGINTMAEVMLAATSRAVVDGLECVGPLKTADDVVTAKLDLAAGSIDLPPGPGLGVELDASKLDRYRFDA